MATPLVTIDWKLFQMMPYIILLHVRKIYYPTTSHLWHSKAKTYGGGGHIVRVNVSFSQIRQSQLTVCFHLLPAFQVTYLQGFYSDKICRGL